jgi:hypothetical protein
MLAVEVVALMFALPGAIVALRELWVHRRVGGHPRRSRIEFEINVRLSIRRR